MRTSRVLVTCIASLIPALAVSVAHAQAKDEKLDSREFVMRAAEANVAEIKLSELAQSNALSADVKQFAQQMIADHTEASAQLAKVAASRKMKVPDDTDVTHKAAMKMLKAKSGENFDKAYLDQMNNDHQMVIDLFQSASTSADVDAGLRAFASKMLPTLHDHHHLVAQVISKQPTSSAAAESSGSKR